MGQGGGVVKCLQGALLTSVQLTAGNNWLRWCSAQAWNAGHGVAFPVVSEAEAELEPVCLLINMNILPPSSGERSESKNHT